MQFRKPGGKRPEAGVWWWLHAWPLVSSGIMPAGFSISPRSLRLLVCSFLAVVEYILFVNVKSWRRDTVAT